MAGEKCNRGWNQKGVQEHVEAADNKAGTALDLAETNEREIGRLKERLADLEGQPNE